MSSKKTAFSFEQSLDALESTVEQLESGDLTLEDALQAFEKGVTLTRECQEALNQAQTRINVLVEKDGAPLEQPISTTEPSNPLSTQAKPDTYEDIPF